MTLAVAEPFQFVRVLSQFVVGMCNVVVETLRGAQDILQMHVMGLIRIARMAIVEDLNLLATARYRGMVRGHDATQFVRYGLDLSNQYVSLVEFTG